MKLYFKIFLFVFLFCLLNFTNANINLAVSPILYEIEGHPGETINKTATIYNKTFDTINITTSKSNFESRNEFGNPIFVRTSELTNPSQELESWITIETDNFELLPRGEKLINFTINVPIDANPGGHYGAIFFENKNTNSETSDELALNVDYGILILINISGDVIKEGEVEEIVINNSGGGGWGGGIIKETKDNCLLGDYSGNYYDDKCFSISSNSDLNTNSSTGITDDDFNISFKIPFKNKGNTHIKPDGKIILIDEDGNVLKGIGKIKIENDAGVIIGEQIVDYISINDNGGNVLPDSNRNFDGEWNGFYDMGFNEDGKKIIKVIDPGTYYSDQNLGNITFFKPRQEVKERFVRKKIKAVTNLGYNGLDNEPVEFNSANEFYIEYKEQYIGCNYIIFFWIFFFLILLIILLSIIIFLFKKKNKEDKNEKEKKLKKKKKVRKGK